MTVILAISTTAQAQQQNGFKKVCASAGAALKEETKRNEMRASALLSLC